MSGAALATLMASGEVPLSPTMFDSNVFVVKRTGAPVEWRPIDPVVANVGYSGIVARAPHPHAALLFIDYLHSKEGQQLVVKGGLSSPETTLSLWYRKNSKKPISRRNTPSTNTRRNSKSGKTSFKSSS